jgi:hypothetical protein
MSVKGKRLIYVGPADGANHKPLNVEGVNLTASLLPGTVVEEVATGLQANANAATVFGQELLVADKDQMRSKSVDDAWTENENMVAIKARSGEFLNVLVAATQNITARGVPLSLNGSGLLKIAVTPAVVGATSEQVICYSDEIIDTTGGPATGTLVSVRVA